MEKSKKANRCGICLKYYSNKSNLKKHENVICKQKFECQMCEHQYTSRFRLKNHRCKDKINKEYDIGNILKNIPNDKQININIYNGNVNNELNNNSKNELNNNSKNKKNCIKIKNNFLNTMPKNYNFDYVVTEHLLNNLNKYIEIDGYKEEEADQFMYEADKFQEQNEEVKRKYEKEPLKVDGMKEFFTELQKDPNNRNIIIKKSKSGKCYSFDTDWKENNVNIMLKKICNKICDTIHDKETSLNHFIREIIASQPRRYTDLKKHIENELWLLCKKVNEEEKLINNQPNVP